MWPCAYSMQSLEDKAMQYTDDEVLKFALLYFLKDLLKDWLQIITPPPSPHTHTKSYKIEQEMVCPPTRVHRDRQKHPSLCYQKYCEISVVHETCLHRL